jgi:ribonuclease HI
MGSSVLDRRAIHIYTDGSCYKNPGGDSGCAAIVQFPEHLKLCDEQIVDFGCDESSVNRMELMACVEALKWVCDSAPWSDVTRVLVVTDSLYVADWPLRTPQIGSIHQGVQPRGVFLVLANTKGSC